MQARTNQNQQPRGVQGRPEVRARETFGEVRVYEILAEKKPEITALFANDPRPDAMYERACALSIGAYRKIQDDANESAARQNKSPQRIDEASAVACCLWAMQRKLDPGTDVYLVPYGGKVTPIISPEGVIKLLFRTGMVKSVNARAVFHGEEFDYNLGTDTWIKHKKNNVRPTARKDNRGQVAENKAEWDALSYAYAIIELKDGGKTTEVLDKADIMYFRSLSPTGESQYGGWAKFPAAFGRKAALKQAAKFVPKESEVSIILAMDDTDRGLEIPDEIMKAVGARMLADMTSEQPQGATSQTGAPATNAAEPPPNTQHSGKQAPRPGDPKAIFLPGTPPQPSIWDAPENLLVEAEARSRAQFDAGKWNDKYWDKNAIQLATMRNELRERGLPVTPHAFFDAGIVLEPAAQEPAGYAEREPGMEG